MMKVIVITIFFNGKLVKVFDSGGWSDLIKMKDYIEDYLTDMFESEDSQ